MLCHSLLRPDLLDQINISAVLYAGALGSLAKYDSSDYLTFPIQAIIVINVGWILSKSLSHLTTTRLFGIKKFQAGAVAAFTIIIAEQFLIRPSFYTVVAQMKKSATVNPIHLYSPIPRSPIDPRKRRRGEYNHTQIFTPLIPSPLTQSPLRPAHRIPPKNNAIHHQRWAREGRSPCTLNR